MSNVINLTPPARAGLRCYGVARDAQNPNAITVAMSRRVTDDELTYLHDVLRRAAKCSAIRQ